MKPVYAKALLAQNVLRLRTQKSLTQEQLAAAIGVSTKTICNLEQGQFGKRFGVQHVLLLADALDCPASVLFLPPTT